MQLSDSKFQSPAAKGTGKIIYVRFPLPGFTGVQHQPRQHLCWIAVPAFMEADEPATTDLSLEYA